MTTTTSTRDDASTLGPPDDWVPADQRVAGIDRRTIWPGIVLLVVWALWAHVMPWIDDQIESDNPIVAGDVINLGFGQVTFEPAVGWNLDAGTLLVDGEEDAVGVPTSATVSSETVGYTVKSGNWDGTAEELADQMIDVNEALDQLLAKDEQGRATIVNADGVPGEIVYILGTNSAALIATFVFEQAPDATGVTGTPIGVEIEIRGATNNLQEQVEEIAGMINSTTYRAISQEENS
jgi:hypothetical protein